MKSKEKPFVLFVAEKIYLEVSSIKQDNPDYSNIDAIDAFIGSKMYQKISSGEFHDEWLDKIEKDKFIDQITGNKIPGETIKLLKIQKDIMVKQLINFPELYYTKSHYPLEISQRAFNHLWRMCESYELWCKETNQDNLIILKL